jgi:glycine/D-amino acid oxidase-like deaminating enzyme
LYRPIGKPHVISAPSNEHLSGIQKTMASPRILPHVVVVGAGIVGAATAYYLQQAGATVTIVDARTPSAGATGASDGAVSVATKRPGPMMRLALEARTLYRSLTRDGVLAGLFHTRPTYLFARTAEEASLLHKHGDDLEREGERVVPMTRKELLQQVPGLGTSILSALEAPDDGHALGYQIVNRLLARAGIEPRRYAEVRRLTVAQGRVVGVETDTDRIAADMVVVAAGLGSGGLIGLDDILIPRKGQLVVTDRAVANGAALPGPLMSAAYLAAKRAIKPVASPESGAVSLVIDPLRTGQFLIGSSREEGRGDRQTDAPTVAAILREALDVYPPIARQRVIRTFAGVRTATRDGLPIVGRHPQLAGLVVATGFEGDGICLGPLMGAAAARLACGYEPEFDIAALSPERFFVADTVRNALAATLT